MNQLIEGTPYQILFIIGLILLSVYVCIGCVLIGFYLGRKTTVRIEESTERPKVKKNQGSTILEDAVNDPWAEALMEQANERRIAGQYGD